MRLRLSPLFLLFAATAAGCASSGAGDPPAAERPALPAATAESADSNRYEILGRASLDFSRASALVTCGSGVVYRGALIGVENLDLLRPLAAGSVALAAAAPTLRFTGGRVLDADDAPILGARVRVVDGGRRALFEVPEGSTRRLYRLWLDLNERLPPGTTMEVVGAY